MRTVTLGVLLFVSMSTTALADCLLGNCVNGRSVYQMPYQEKTDERTGEQYNEPGGYYIGDVDSSKPNGLGVGKWFERIKNSLAFSEWIYAGIFKDGKPYGRGIARRSDGGGSREIYIGDFMGDIKSAKPGSFLIRFSGVQDIFVYKVGVNNSLTPHMNNTISLHCRFQPNRIEVPKRCSELTQAEIDDRADAMIDYIYSSPLFSEHADKATRESDPIKALDSFISGVKRQSESIINRRKFGQKLLDELFENPQTSIKSRR